jgi:hypothetical protein
MGIVIDTQFGMIYIVPQTLGYHIVLAGYGLWLPGDARGSWSTRWDEELGLIEPHTLHPADPVRLRMSTERFRGTAVRLDGIMVASLIATIQQCIDESDWSVAAASIESTHTHLLLTFTERNIDDTIKWIKDRATKAIHRDTCHTGPVWCKGSWRSFLFDLDVWQGVQTYIEQHNIRRGVGSRPYQFVNPTFMA